ncbi:porin family protein [Xanthobacteraceae bacterium Astr-EGSB]|uniref:outer membrane protein n=1 Tax=Astrobacterium formosum TaxID=3069710 RepID=UPI0027B07994|nr:porin family protein [Xanthobacteraceae bacterium Astr-EGSB]
MRVFLGAMGVVLGLSAGASAADMSMPVKAPPPAPALYSWTGLYIGGHLGGGWANNGWNDPSTTFGTFADVDADGILGGGQVGFNWQWSNIVLGLEAQFSASNIDGSASFAAPPLGTVTLSNEINWITSVTGRLGFAANNWLIYGKGGWAWADFDGAASLAIPGATTLSVTSDGDRDGWTAGAGVEWGFAPNWSALVEYQYYDFGDETFSFGGVPVGIDTDIHTVKVGLNYRLGGLFR